MLTNTETTERDEMTKAGERLIRAAKRAKDPANVVSLDPNVRYIKGVKYNKLPDPAEGFVCPEIWYPLNQRLEFSN